MCVMTTEAEVQDFSSSCMDKTAEDTEAADSAEVEVCNDFFHFSSHSGACIIRNYLFQILTIHNKTPKMFSVHNSKIFALFRKLHNLKESAEKNRFELSGNNCDEFETGVFHFIRTIKV